MAGNEQSCGWDMVYEKGSTWKGRWKPYIGDGNNKNIPRNVSNVTENTTQKIVERRNNISIGPLSTNILTGKEVKIVEDVKE